METASSYWFAAYASNVLHTGCYCKANPVTALERLSRRTCGDLRVYALDAGSQDCSATSKAGTEDSACHDARLYVHRPDLTQQSINRRISVRHRRPDP